MNPAAPRAINRRRAVSRVDVDVEEFEEFEKDLSL